MTLVHHHAGWVIWTSFLVALILTILPLPAWAGPYRPEWTLLVLIYWCMAIPQRVCIGVGWVVGILLDALRESLLGQNALGFALAAFVTIKLHQRLRVFSGPDTKVSQIAAILACDQAFLVEAANRFNDFRVGVFMDFDALKTGFQVVTNQHIQFVHLLG